MNRSTKILLTGLFLVGSTVANAEIIDFVDMTENNVSGLGESAWTTLTIPTSEFSVDITATKDGQSAYAYLDNGHAGLGVCGEAGNDNGSVDTSRTGLSSNICNPGSDDNVTTGEALTFIFDTDVIINKIWFNNTHDPDRTIIDPDFITINGVPVLAVGNGYAPTSDQYNTLANYDSSVDNWVDLDSFLLIAGSELTIAYNNEQFYVSGMEVSAVPIPGALVLFCSGLFGLRIFRRKSQPA